MTRGAREGVVRNEVSLQSSWSASLGEHWKEGEPERVWLSGPDQGFIQSVGRVGISHPKSLISSPKGRACIPLPFSHKYELLRSPPMDLTSSQKNPIIAWSNEY